MYAQARRVDNYDFQVDIKKGDVDRAHDVLRQNPKWAPLEITSVGYGLAAVVGIYDADEAVAVEQMLRAEDFQPAAQ